MLRIFDYQTNLNTTMPLSAIIFFLVLFALSFVVGFWLDKGKWKSKRSK